MIRCPNPVRLRDGREFNCGHCGVCLQNKADEWKTRLRLQEDVSSTALFVTLTYDEDHLPKDEKGNPCFSRQHLKIYHAKLREYIKRGFFIDDFTGKRFDLPNRKFKYFLTSEYGPDEGHRPHYHVIYFDLPELYTAELLIRKSWTYADVITVSPLTPGRISYCAEYALGARLARFAPADWMKPIFVVSNHIGDASMYCSESLLNWWRENPTKRVYFPTPTKSGRMSKAPLGRYLKQKIFDDDMRTRIEDERAARYRPLTFRELQMSREAAKLAEDHIIRKKLHTNG